MLLFASISASISASFASLRLRLLLRPCVDLHHPVRDLSSTPPDTGSEYRMATSQTTPPALSVQCLYETVIGAEKSILDDCLNGLLISGRKKVFTVQRSLFKPSSHNQRM